MFSYVWCDVVFMHACHLLLSRSYKYDRDIAHSERHNTYTINMKGKYIVLPPKRKVVIV